jgi:hypothetical protein
MAKQGKGVTKNDKARAQKAASRSAPLIAGGDITNAQQFARVMSAILSDALTGAIKPAEGNLACNAAGKLLKVTEMQLKYGPKGGGPLQLG